MIKRKAVTPNYWIVLSDFVRTANGKIAAAARAHDVLLAADICRNLKFLQLLCQASCVLFQL